MGRNEEAKEKVFICAHRKALLFSTTFIFIILMYAENSYIYVNIITTPYQSQTHIRNEMKVRPSRVETNNYN